MGSARLNLLSKHEDAHDDALWCTTWVPNQNQCITGSVDECVKVWAVQDEPPYVENSHTYTSHTLGVVSVTVDPTGTFAASSALDSFIRVWNLQVKHLSRVLSFQPRQGLPPMLLESYLPAQLCWGCGGIRGF